MTFFSSAQCVCILRNLLQDYLVEALWLIDKTPIFLIIISDLNHYIASHQPSPYLPQICHKFPQAMGRMDNSKPLYWNVCPILLPEPDLSDGPSILFLLYRNFKIRDFTNWMRCGIAVMAAEPPEAVILVSVNIKCH